MFPLLYPTFMLKICSATVLVTSMQETIARPRPTPKSTKAGLSAASAVNVNPDVNPDMPDTSAIATVASVKSVETPSVVPVETTPLPRMIELRLGPPKPPQTAGEEPPPAMKGRQGKPAKVDPKLLTARYLHAAQMCSRC
jgi:hypothetical protein